MKKLSYSLTLILFVVTISCHKNKSVDDTSNQIKNEHIETKIDSIIALLSLEEKVGLVHAQSKFSTKGVDRLGIP